MLCDAIYIFVLLLFTNLLHFNFLILRDPSVLRGPAFAVFWKKWTAPLPSTDGQPAEKPPPAVSDPPIVSSSADIAPLLLAQAEGNVLELGAGSGTQLKFYDETKVKALFAVEPSSDLHLALRLRAEEAKLTSKLIILPCQGEKDEIVKTLKKEGITHSDLGGKHDGFEMFDTLVIIRVLCSVPDPKTTAEELWKMLKPGGKLLCLEHVKNPWRTTGSFSGRLAQRIYTMLGWSWFMGDCSMERDTDFTLKHAGPWKSVKTDIWFPWSVFSYLRGVYVKGE